MAAEVAHLEERVLACAARVHAANAELAAALADLDAAEGWCGAGIRSLGHWCDINLGIPSRSAARLGLAAGRLAELPLLREAFAEGALSIDKVLLAAEVATPATDERFTTIARTASVAQLQRICSEYRKLDADESPDELTRRRRRRGVRRATALVELSTEGLVEGPDPVVRGERVEVRVHIDAEVLAGTRPDGISFIEGIGPVAPAIVRRLLCDAKVCTVTEQLDGIFNLGRSRRTVSRRQRRALHRRDRGCRFPGCRMRRFVDAHHVLPWEDLGPTDMDNLVLLCPTHHTLFHEGEYRIDALGGGRFDLGLTIDALAS